MKLQGDILVPNTIWGHVYSSILIYFNEVISTSYKKALEFYNLHSKSSVSELNSLYEEFVVAEKLSELQSFFIRNSLFSGKQDFLYKPKKTHFKPFTNRTSLIETNTIKIQFDKTERHVKIDIQGFEDLNDLLRTNTFISEFINMANTINWPTRPGPNKRLRGCTLTAISSVDTVTFYKVGPNPPIHSGAVDSTLPEPGELKSQVSQNIKLVSEEQHTQPLPEQEESEF